jgi:hypothetical protein
VRMKDIPKDSSTGDKRELPTAAITASMTAAMTAAMTGAT